jgi:hypothetical protein
MTRGYIAVEQDGVVEVHASGVIGDYATLCGMDGDDLSVGQRPAPLQIGARINCQHCILIIRTAKKYRERDFATGPDPARR